MYFLADRKPKGKRDERSGREPQRDRRVKCVGERNHTKQRESGERPTFTEQLEVKGHPEVLMIKHLSRIQL